MRLTKQAGQGRDRDWGRDRDRDRQSRVHGAGCRVHGARCTVHGAQCTVHGAGCTVQGARCTVQARGTVPKEPLPQLSRLAKFKNLVPSDLQEQDSFARAAAMK